MFRFDLTNPKKCMRNTWFGLVSISLGDGITLILATILILIHTTSASFPIITENCESLKKQTETILLMGFYKKDFIVLTREDKVYKSSGFINKDSYGYDLIRLPQWPKTLADVYPNLANNENYQRKKSNFSAGMILKDQLIFLMNDCQKNGINYNLKTGLVIDDGYTYDGPNRIHVLTRWEDSPYFYRLGTDLGKSVAIEYTDIGQNFKKIETEKYMFCKNNSRMRLVYDHCPDDKQCIQNDFWIGFQHDFQGIVGVETMMYVFDSENVTILKIDEWQGELYPPYRTMAIEDAFDCEKGSGSKAALIIFLLILLILVLVGILYYYNCFASWGLAGPGAKDKKSKLSLKRGSKTDLKSGLKSGQKLGSKSAIGKRKSSNRIASKNSQTRRAHSKPSKLREPLIASKWPPTLPTSLMEGRSMKNKASSRTQSKQKQ